MIFTFKFDNKKLRIYLERHSDFSAFYQVFIEKSYPHLVSRIGEGNTIIDAGANIGVFSMMASILVGKTGKVISIEPDPENINILQKNIQLNQLDNVVIVPKALYSESGKILKFYQDGVMSKIIINTLQNEYKSTEVDTITLNEIIEKFDLKPNALKMDIEGAEKFALLKADKVMKEINYFEGEIHSQEDYKVLMSYSDIFNFKQSPAESLHNVFNFAIKYPLKTLELEYSNRFKTTKRLLFSTTNKSQRTNFRLSCME